MGSSEIEMRGKLYDRMSRSASRLTSQNVSGLYTLPIYDFYLRATHARALLPAALAPVSFGFVLVRVRESRLDSGITPGNG